MTKGLNQTIMAKTYLFRPVFSVYQPPPGPYQGNLYIYNCRPSTRTNARPGRGII